LDTARIVTFRFSAKSGLKTPFSPGDPYVLPDRVKFTHLQRVIAFLPMRIALLLCCVAGILLPAPAEAQDGWEAGFGPHIIRRENSSSIHVGGGATAARRFGRFAGVVEGGGTRREGHNDWRALAGVRVRLDDATGRTSFFVQTLGGVLIRSRESDWAILPGLGVDMGLSGNRALRLQLDAPIERSQSRTVAGGRASVWLIFGRQQ